MTKRRRALAVLAAAAGTSAAQASELTYTYVDFQAFSSSGAQSGQQVPVPSQTVAVQTADGDGIALGGALSIGRRFFVGGRFQTSIVDVDAVITNPLIGVTTATDNFDVIQSRMTVGYYREIKDNLDVTLELSLDSREYDFGTFAGESFDMSDDGLGVRAGFRWNPRTPLEISGYVHHSAVGEADLTTGAFDSDTSVGIGAMWYFFEDLGVGAEYASGQMDSVAFSMRFSFGDLGLQR